MPGSFSSFRTQLQCHISSEWSCLAPVSRFLLGSRLFSFTATSPSENLPLSIMTLWCLCTCVLSVSLQRCKLHDSGCQVHYDSRALSSLPFAGAKETVEEVDCGQRWIKSFMPQCQMPTIHSRGDVQQEMEHANMKLSGGIYSRDNHYELATHW